MTPEEIRQEMRRAEEARARRRDWWLITSGWICVGSAGVVYWLAWIILP